MWTDIWNNLREHGKHIFKLSTESNTEYCKVVRVLGGGWGGGGGDEGTPYNVLYVEVPKGVPFFMPEVHFISG